MDKIDHTSITCFVLKEANSRHATAMLNSFNALQRIYVISTLYKYIFLKNKRISQKLQTSGHAVN